MLAIAEAVSPVPGLASMGRPQPDDIARVREAGVRHVVDLTLDAETPDFDEAAAVRAAGLEYSNLPVRRAVDLTLENAKAFGALVRNAKPCGRDGGTSRCMARGQAHG